jgi:hypothetical protein
MILRYVWHWRHDVQDSKIAYGNSSSKKINSNSNKLTNQMQQFHKFITWRFVSLNLFRAPPRPSSGDYNCINSLWLVNLFELYEDARTCQRQK